MHSGDLSAHTDKTTSGQIFPGGIDQFLYMIRHVSQVFTVGCSVDVDHRPNIVVILDRGGSTARNRGDISQNLALSLTSEDR